MNQRSRRTLIAGAAIWSAAAAPGALAQEAAPSLTPLKLQIVFSRYAGEKKVMSAPYTLFMLAAPRSERRIGRLRMGIQVPVRSENKEGKSEVSYRDIGNNVDCTSDLPVGGRFNVFCSFDQSSLYPPEDERPSGPTKPATGPEEVPVFRSFRNEAYMLLRDGETVQTSATDPVSGEVVKVDLTLSVLK
jgi:hypothetical protein